MAESHSPADFVDNEEEALEQEDQAPEQDEQSVKEPTQEERFEEALKSHGLTRVEAAEILDTLLTGEDYTREYKVTEKLSVTFRTRSTKEVTWITEMIDKRAPNTRGTYEHLITKFNMPAALVKITGPKARTFDHGTYKDYISNLEWVDENLNSMAFTALAQKLHEFDSMLNLVLSGMNIENF